MDDDSEDEAGRDDEAKTRPLFNEEMDDIGRLDEWSEPHGFLFVAMTNPIKPELSRQFLDAANLLANAILNKEYEDYKLANPVMYLYRHSIELILKCALGGDTDGHKLDVLADLFVRRCQEQYGQVVPRWITARLKEMARVDPNSTTFRYGENWDHRTKQHVRFDGEFHVHLRDLQSAMNELHAALAGLVGKISGQRAGVESSKIGAS